MFSRHHSVSHEDLPWKHVPLVSAHQIKQLLEARVACVIYVYSPTCGACVARFKGFDDAVGSMPGNVKNRFFRYNAVPSPDKSHEAFEKFKQATGISISYYPSVFGFSKAMHHTEYEGSYMKEHLEAFLRSLENGSTAVRMSRNK